MFPGMDASLQALIDEVCNICEAGDERSLWQASPDDLSLRLRHNSPSCALDMRLDRATVDDALVSVTWAWRADDGHLRVGQLQHIASGLADSQLRDVLDRVASQLPTRMVTQLLAELD
jgi:hypothetical protein